MKAKEFLPIQLSLLAFHVITMLIEGDYLNPWRLVAMVFTWLSVYFLLTDSDVKEGRI
jgi:hypothetical protein